jgi:D-arabinose 1-dehydrogenase-like Zn-dependent alcohol dehydrogenase
VKAIVYTKYGSPEDLAFVKGFPESGKCVPVIRRRYPLRETAEAFRYLAEGHARGQIDITVEHRSNFSYLFAAAAASAARRNAAEIKR